MRARRDEILKTFPRARFYERRTRPRPGFEHRHRAELVQNRHMCGRRLGHVTPQAWTPHAKPATQPPRRRASSATPSRRTCCRRFGAVPGDRALSQIERTEGVRLRQSPAPACRGIPERRVGGETTLISLTAVVGGLAAGRLELGPMPPPPLERSSYDRNFTGLIRYRQTIVGGRRRPGCPCC